MGVYLFPFISATKLHFFLGVFLHFITGDDIYTHNGALRRRLEQLAQDRPEDCRFVKASHDGKAVEYIIPKKWLRVNPPRTAVQLTEEQKQKRREQLEKVRKGKNKA